VTYLDAFIIAASECDTDDKRACCSFAKRLEELVHGASAVAAVDNKLWNLWPESKDPWGPVTACVKARFNPPVSGRAVSPGGYAHALEPGVHRVQGWRGAPFVDGVTGHTITVVVPVAEAAGRVMVLDSAAKDRAGNVRGPKAAIVVWADYAAQFKGGIASCRLGEA
jgi:hypothetical protein